MDTRQYQEGLRTLRDPVTLADLRQSPDTSGLLRQRSILLGVTALLLYLLFPALLWYRVWWGSVAVVAFWYVIINPLASRVNTALIEHVNHLRQ